MTQKPHVWPSLRYEDPVAAMRFLSDALGFVKVVEYQNDEGIIEHAQMSWPNGGGIMLGQARENSAIAELPAGTGAVYLVAPDPDELFVRAKSAGATIVMELTDQEYGSRDFTVRDQRVFFGPSGRTRARSPAQREAG